MQLITGFSKLDTAGKINILKKNIVLNDQQVSLLSGIYQKENQTQNIIENLSENYLTDYTLPFSIAPNFRLNNKWYFVPMVTEESSVVAAVSYAAKFWCGIDGFKTKVIGSKKNGQIFFKWKGDIERLQSGFPLMINKMRTAVKQITGNMEKRGGGISEIKLNRENTSGNDYYIIDVEFETADAMGANFINTCLEKMGSELKSFTKEISDSGCEAEIIMAILSNYTPECLVECVAECDTDKLSEVSGNLSAEHFAEKFRMAVQIANENISRAVTHNKGIFNGIDAVLLATGNDFRAVEACGHAYAARGGRYEALTDIEITGNRFRYILRMPLSVGTVGGATSVHPLARLALHIMHNPTAHELMEIAACAGLAANFAAIRSLITNGIQKGHMKLHLSNILLHFNANISEKKLAEDYFRDKHYSFKSVSDYLTSLRDKR